MVGRRALRSRPVILDTVVDAVDVRNKADLKRGKPSQERSKSNTKLGKTREVSEGDDENIKNARAKTPRHERAVDAEVIEAAQTEEIVGTKTRSGNRSGRRLLEPSPKTSSLSSGSPLGLSGSDPENESRSLKDIGISSKRRKSMEKEPTRVEGTRRAGFDDVTESACKKLVKAKRIKKSPKKTTGRKIKENEPPTIIEERVSNGAMSGMKAENKCEPVKLQEDESSPSGPKKRSKTTTLTAAKREKRKNLTTSSAGGRRLRIKATAESKVDRSPFGDALTSVDCSDVSTGRSKSTSTIITKTQPSPTPDSIRKLGTLEISDSPAHVKSPSSISVGDAASTLLTGFPCSEDPSAPTSVGGSKKRVSFADVSAGAEELVTSKKARKSSSSSAIATFDHSPKTSTEKRIAESKSASIKPRAMSVRSEGAAKRVRNSKEIEAKKDPYAFDEEDTIDARLTPSPKEAEASPMLLTAMEEMPIPGGRVEEMERSLCLSASKKRKKGKMGNPSKKGTKITAKKKKLSMGNRMAKMRLAIETLKVPTSKRKSILKNADALKQHPKGVKDHSTPNQIGGGVQTKISQFLKDQVGLGKDKRQPLSDANVKLNNSLFGFDANPTPGKNLGNRARLGEAELSNISSVSALLSPIQKMCQPGARNFENDSTAFSLVNSFARDSVASFTGKVISKKNPEAEELFLKPGAAKKKGKENSGEPPAKAKRVKKTEKVTGSKVRPRVGSSGSKRKKEAAGKEEAKENNDVDEKVEGEAFEAWCKKQNQHFDDCESFELSIEVDPSE